MWLRTLKVQIFVRLAAARAPPLPDTILTKLTLAHHSLVTSFRLEIIDLEPQTKPSNLNSTNFSNNLLIVTNCLSPCFRVLTSVQKGTVKEVNDEHPRHPKRAAGVHYWSSAGERAVKVVWDLPWPQGSCSGPFSVEEASSVFGYD